MSRGLYGPPYTLTLNVSAPFTLSGADTILSLASALHNPTESLAVKTLVCTTNDGIPYPLRNVSSNDGHDPGQPGHIWTNQSSSTHTPVPIVLPASLRIETDMVNGSRVWMNDTFVGRFEVFVYGGRNTVFSWSQLAIVAPIGRIDGGVDSLVLEAGVGLKVNGRGNEGSNATPAGNAGERLKRSGPSIWAVMGCSVVILVWV